MTFTQTNPMNALPRNLALLATLLLLPFATIAQQPKPDPVALPKPVTPDVPAVAA